MRKYDYDRWFMKEAYPLWQKAGMSDEEILSFYNLLYAEEAAQNEAWDRRFCSLEAFNPDTWEENAVDDPTDEFLDTVSTQAFGLKEQLLPVPIEAVMLQNGSPLYLIFISLTPQQQTILILKFNGIKQTAIASIFGVSNAAISKQMRAIRNKFEAYYQKNKRQVK